MPKIHENSTIQETSNKLENFSELGEIISGAHILVNDVINIGLKNEVPVSYLMHLIANAMSQYYKQQNCILTVDYNNTTAYMEVSKEVNGALQSMHDTIKIEFESNAGNVLGNNNFPQDEV